MPWYLPEGREIGTLPAATPPSFYVEQANKRLREAASLWGVPLGVLVNYSIMDTSSAGSAMGVGSFGGDKNGLGGATSSTLSMAWKSYEKSMAERVMSIKKFSKHTLSRMSKSWRDAMIPAAIEAYQRNKLEQFERENGTEAQFQTQLMNSHYNEDTKGVLETRRAAEKQRYMEDECGSTKCLRAAEASLPAEARMGDLYYHMNRLQQLEQIIALWQANILRSQAAVRVAAATLDLRPSDFELPEAMDDVRETANQPLPESEPPEDGEGGGSKSSSSKKAKK